MEIGTKDGIGIVVVYHAPCDPELSFWEFLSGFVLAALLRSPRLLVLGDFNIHAETEVTGPALQFLEMIISLDMSQFVKKNNPRGRSQARPSLVNKAGRG